jgi:hypothetical protein
MGGAKMKIAIMTSLSAKWYMNINARQSMIFAFKFISCEVNILKPTFI